MKLTDPYIEQFPMEFNTDPNTSFIKPEPDNRTPYEQYEAGEEWIYVDLRDFFPNEKPYWMTRYGYFDKFLHIRHRENLRPVRNFKITFPDEHGDRY